MVVQLYSSKKYKYTHGKNFQEICIETAIIVSEQKAMEI